MIYNKEKQQDLQRPKVQNMKNRWAHIGASKMTLQFKSEVTRIFLWSLFSPPRVVC